MQHLNQLPSSILDALKCQSKPAGDAQMDDEADEDMKDLKIDEGLEDKCPYCDKVQFRDHYTKVHHLALCPKTLRVALFFVIL